MILPNRWLLTPSDTALLILDAQNDYLAPGGGLNDILAGQLKRHNTIAHLKTLIHGARAAGIPVLYSRLEFSQGDYLIHECHHLSGFNRMIFDFNLFQKGTWGADIYAELQPQPNDIVLSPHTSLDSFFSNLPDHLAHLSIEKLVIGGLSANLAVLGTVNTARERGFEAIVASDAVAAQSETAYEHALAWTLPFAASLLLSADEIADLLLAPKRLTHDRLDGASVFSNDGGWIGNVSVAELTHDDSGHLEVAPPKPGAKPIYIPQNCISKTTEKRIYLGLPGRLADLAQAGWSEEIRKSKAAA